MKSRIEMLKETDSLLRQTRGVGGGDNHVLKEARGRFRVYVDDKPVLYPMSQWEAEKLADFLRLQFDESIPEFPRGYDPELRQTYSQ